MTHKKPHKAFSLIEISIVILIIGVLIAGVSTGIDMYNDMKIASARNLTINSRVGRIPDLVAWYETTLENNFSSGTSSYNDIKNISKDQVINRWKDISPMSLVKKHATQNTLANQPKIIIDKDALLPVVNFTSASAQFLNLPDGTVPYGNSAYTVIIVSEVFAPCSCGILGSGTYGTNNVTNSIRYSLASGLSNYWWSVDLSMSSVITSGKNSVLTFIYDLTKRDGYVDGVLRGSVASSNRASTQLNNTIGTTNGTEYLNGNIGEIIIYDRDLSTKERQDIEAYLIKKWSIKI